MHSRYTKIICKLPFNADYWTNCTIYIPFNKNLYYVFRIKYGFIHNKTIQFGYLCSSKVFLERILNKYQSIIVTVSARDWF